MAGDEKGVVHRVSDGGVTGTHPDVETRPLLVAPATGSEFNAAILGLIPVGCWKVEDTRFAFASSFVTPDLAKEIQALADLRKAHSKPDPASKTTLFPPLSVFGHADPVGTDDTNKALSGRRATAVYAVLISKEEPDAAVALWKQIASAENWGASQRQTMQTSTGLPKDTSDSELFKAYMQSLNPADLQLTKKDFLAQGADAKGKGDFQGCSEFNPALIFSKKANDDFEKSKDKTARNAANSLSRRVMVLLFRTGSKIDPAKWPCPRASEGVAGCKKRFWSDGDTRRSKRLPDKDRKFDDTQDTFACRFYQRLVTNSPCEALATLVKIRLFDPQARPLPFAPCLVTESGQKPRADRATGAPVSPAGTTPGSPPGSSSSGSTDDSLITLRVTKLPATVNVKWSRPKATEGSGAPLPNDKDLEDFEFEMDVAIDIQDTDANQAGRMRLKNLGYDLNLPIPVPGLGNSIRSFQRDYKAKFGGIVEDGTLNPPTIDAIKTSHEAVTPVLRAGSQIDVKR
jgi:OmpA family